MRGTISSSLLCLGVRGLYAFLLPLFLLGAQCAPAATDPIRIFVGDSRVRFTWTNHSETVQGYHIYRREYGDGKQYGLPRTVALDDQLFEDKGLANWWPYTYRIVPVLMNGVETEPVTEITACPIPAPAWKYISPEPVVATGVQGIPAQLAIGRPGMLPTWWGFGFTATDTNGHSHIGRVERNDYQRDCLENPVPGTLLDAGTAGGWDGSSVSDPESWSDNRMVYAGFNGSCWRIGMAALDNNWLITSQSMILDVGSSSWDSMHVRDPNICNGGIINEMFYSGYDGVTWRIGRAWYSEQTKTWVKDVNNPVLDVGFDGEWDSRGVFSPYVVLERAYPPLYVMYYTGTDGSTSQIGYATSPDGVHWAKHADNPVLSTRWTPSWCSAGVGHPTGYDYGGETHLWFEGTDGAQTSVGKAVVQRTQCFGRQTAILVPNWLDATLEYYNAPAIYDALYDYMIDLNGGRVNIETHQGLSYASRTFGGAWNGNPVTIGGGWLRFQTYPSFPRTGSYVPGLFAHEAGHNFQALLPTLMYLVDGHPLDYHGMVWINQLYSESKLASTYTNFGLTADQIKYVREDVEAEAIDSARNTADLESWVHGGGTIESFIARQNGQRVLKCGFFYVLGREYGLDMWRSVYRACRAGIIPDALLLSADTPVKKSTFLVCLLSVACRTDLRARFRNDWGYSLDDGYYEAIYPGVDSAMAGETNPPLPPSNLRAIPLEGPRVRLEWTASSSPDVGHYHIYCDCGTGVIDYSSPLDEKYRYSQWQSPVLGGGMNYLFGVRAVDQWDNEETNRNQIVSLYMPSSPAPFIREWLVLGPYVNTNWNTLRTKDYTSTGEANLSPYPGQVETSNCWRRVMPFEHAGVLPPNEANLVDLYRILSFPYMGASYAHTYVYSPGMITCRLRYAHDDDCRIWLNGVMIDDRGGWSGYYYDDVEIAITLVAGWNRLCFKVCNGGGPHNFSARICSSQGAAIPGLRYSIDIRDVAPRATVSRSSVLYEDVPMGSSEAHRIGVLNRGQGVLCVTNASFHGLAAGDYSSTFESLSLRAGEGAFITITFSPQATGVRTAELVLLTSDPLQPSIAISLSGVGRTTNLYVNDDSRDDDIFTSATGNDTNSGCEPSAPMRTISAVLKEYSLGNGDVIYVDAGCYRESIGVSSENYRFRIQGAGVDRTFIDGENQRVCLAFTDVTDAQVSSLTLRNGTGFLSYESTYGGALYSTWSELLVRDVVLRDSMADYGGGGYFSKGHVTLESLRVSNNQALQGGGIHGDGDTVLSNSVFMANSASNWGGGTYGGALYNCTLTGNSAGIGGGGAEEGTLYNCTLTDNNASWGGGVYYSTLYNCTLTENTAENGGGGAEGGVFYNCTLMGNHAFRGGGVYYAGLFNCIIYYNTASDGANGYSGTFTYCCTVPHPGGAGNITNEPMFAYLAGGNLRLLSNSPCVNAGTNQDWMVDAVDLDGRPRILGGRVDMGAYERGSILPIDWLQKYGLNPDGESDFLDSDEDGMNNWQEWRCKTDPTNETSFLGFMTLSSEGEGFVLRWRSEEGVRYRLDRSTNLCADAFGYLVRTNILATPSINSETDTVVGSGPWFYRVGVE